MEANPPEDKGEDSGIDGARHNTYIPHDAEHGAGVQEQSGA